MESRQPGPYVGYPTLDDLREIAADYPDQLTIDLGALAAEQARLANARPPDTLPARAPLPRDKSQGTDICSNRLAIKFEIRTRICFVLDMPAKSKGQQAPKRRSQAASMEESTSASAPVRAVPQPAAPSDEQLLMEALEEWDDEQLSPDAARTTSPTPVWSSALAAAANTPKPLPLPVSFDLSAPFREISLADQIAAISQQHVTPTR